jgi:hypothetical protein
MCGRKILNRLPKKVKKNAMVYIASDNRDSALQINKTINWPLVTLNEKSCHVDISNSSACSRFTLSHWFALALSDIIVMQDSVGPQQRETISAFSRYAAIYSLNSQVMRFGHTCDPISKDLQLYQQSQGNWICDRDRN